MSWSLRHLTHYSDTARECRKRTKGPTEPKAPEAQVQACRFLRSDLHLSGFFSTWSAGTQSSEAQDRPTTQPIKRSQKRARNASRSFLGE